MNDGLSGLAVAAGQETALVSTGYLLGVIAVVAILILLLRAALWAGSSRWPRTPVSSRPALLAMTAGGAAVLFVLASAGLHSDGAVRLDAEAGAFFAPYRVFWLLSAFLWLTTLGAGAALTGMVVTATGFLWTDRRRAGLIVPLWVAFAGAQASVWGSKHIIGRARPAFLEGVATAASPSFPSAHTTGAVATLGFIAYAAARGFPTRRGRFEVAFWAAILVSLIGFSRVFLGVHFATDVAGGVLIGGAWLLAGLALAEQQGAK